MILWVCHTVAIATFHVRNTPPGPSSACLVSPLHVQVPRTETRSYPGLILRPQRNLGRQRSCPGSSYGDLGTRGLAVHGTHGVAPGAGRGRAALPPPASTAPPPVRRPWSDAFSLAFSLDKARKPERPEQRTRSAPCPRSLRRSLSVLSSSLELQGSSFHSTFP